ncbi:MAG: hypothetical protein E1N59_1609 [Puniceicoccaceae bacterium 5H]|nr:MAG: hypothetical protein E1N59_1609 [Puniceicoccaceae bacterium 5H]
MKTLPAFLLLCVIGLTGCSTTPKPDLMQFNPSDEAPYPPVTVVAVSEQLDLQILKEALMQGIADANLFEYVTPSGNTDLTMEISMDLSSDGGPAADLGKVAVTGMTLGLVPTKFTYRMSGNVRLRYQGIVFEEFPYETEFSSLLTIASMNSEDAGLRGAVRKSIEAILTELEARQSVPRLLDEVQRREPQPIEPPSPAGTPVEI